MILKRIAIGTVKAFASSVLLALNLREIARIRRWLRQRWAAAK